MLKSRKFKVVLVGQNSGTGDRPMKGGKTISYAGKKKKYKAVTVKRRNVSKLPYYFLGADYADFKNSICIVRVIPRNPRLILQHNEVVIYFIKKETATATQIPSPLP